MDSFSLARSVAHPGHMKREKLRGDSWNLVPARPRKAARTSQVLADSWRVGKIRQCQAASLPRRRSPVRTRCSAPYGPGIPEDFGAVVSLRQRRRPSSSQTVDTRAESPSCDVAAWCSGTCRAHEARLAPPCLLRDADGEAHNRSSDQVAHTPLTELPAP